MIDNWPCPGCDGKMVPIDQDTIRCSYCGITACTPEGFPKTDELICRKCNYIYTGYHDCSGIV